MYVKIFHTQNFTFLHFAMQTILKKLQNKFEPQKSYTLLFSGGFDSACVLGAGIAAGANIEAVWIDNGFNRATADEIKRQAEALGCEKLKILRVEPLQSVRCNSPKRCYVCKRQLLEAAFRGDRILLDGTHADDTKAYRPGMKALQEFSVRSFLKELRISHAQAIEIAQHLGAKTYWAEMESCLATRLNYNLQITPDRLAIIRTIERFIISETSDFNVRCRIDDENHLRIEVSENKTIEKFSEPAFRKKIIEYGQQIALFSTLDLKFSRPNEHDKKLKT